MHIKTTGSRVLAAVAGTARAMRRHKRRTLAAGAALLLVTPLLTGSGVDAFTVNALALGCGALMLGGSWAQGTGNRRYKHYGNRK